MVDLLDPAGMVDMPKQARKKQPKVKFEKEVLPLLVDYLYPDGLVDSPKQTKNKVDML